MAERHGLGQGATDGMSKGMVQTGVELRELVEQTLKKFCRVQVEQVLQAMDDGVQGKPVEHFPEFDENFPERF